MRIFTKDDTTYIQALANSICKDPVSLQVWKCMHVQFPHNFTASITPFNRDHAIRLLKIIYKNTDCDIILFNNELLLISADETEETLREIAIKLMNTLAYQEVDLGIELYNFVSDWRKVLDILLSKLDFTALPPTDDARNILAKSEEDIFPQIFSLARELSKSREPLVIMLVEDDHFTRQLVAHAFKTDYAMITARTALEAIDNYLIYAPDIVFLDIHLPDLDGFNVLEKILHYDPHAFVVMFSGNSYLDNVTNALTHGASGFVSKPFHEKQLQHYIYEYQSVREAR